MSTMATNYNGITLYYNSQTSLGKKILAYTKTSEKKIRSVDISKTKVTGTQWASIAYNLNIKLEEIVNREHPDFQAEYSETTNLSQDDWIKILQANPATVKCPILINKNSFNLVKTPSEVTKILEGESEDFDARNP